MRIESVKTNKKQYLDLLLLADEEEAMIDLYLSQGDMFLIYDDELIGECVIVEGEEGVFELKNIAIYTQFHGCGYGKKLIEYLFEHYQGRGKLMYVGTGDSPLSIPFYKKCGFEISHRVANFFVDNYEKPIYEDGKQLIDMVYLKRKFDDN